MDKIKAKEAEVTAARAAIVPRARMRELLGRAASSERAEATKEELKAKKEAELEKAERKAEKGQGKQGLP